MNETRQDLYTQSAYADLIGVSRQRVNKMVKDGDLKLVEVKGTILIKVD